MDKDAIVSWMIENIEDARNCRGGYYPMLLAQYAGEEFVCEEFELVRADVATADLLVRIAKGVIESKDEQEFEATTEPSDD